jgi:hypothetical protein
MMYCADREKKRGGSLGPRCGDRCEAVGFYLTRDTPLDGTDACTL